MGQHHPQLGAAALLVRLLLQLVHLLQHPLRLRDEPLALLGGDHARGGALENAHPVFLFQILQRLAHIGLCRVQLLCRRRHRPPFHDGYQISQFRNIHEPLRVVCSRNRIVTISPRRCQAGEFFALSRRAAGRFDDFEWPPRALWPYSAEKYFKFRVWSDRVCGAQRSNKSPSGAFKRQSGLR